MRLTGLGDGEEVEGGGLGGGQHREVDQRPQERLVGRPGQQHILAIVCTCT